MKLPEIIIVEDDCDEDRSRIFLFVQKKIMANRLKIVSNRLFIFVWCLFAVLTSNRNVSFVFYYFLGVGVKITQLCFWNWKTLGFKNAQIDYNSTQMSHLVSKLHK